MTDDSFQAAGYASLIENDPIENNISIRQTYAYHSKPYTPSWTKMSTYAKYAKIFLAICLALKSFVHIIWGTTKTVIIMTDSKSVTRFFFQTKWFLHPYRIPAIL